MALVLRLGSTTLPYGEGSETLQSTTQAYNGVDATVRIQQLTVLVLKPKSTTAAHGTNVKAVVNTICGAGAEATIEKKKHDFSVTSVGAKA